MDVLFPKIGEIIGGSERESDYAKLMNRIEEVKTLDPKPLNQWRFVPEEWTRPAIERDYQLLFGNK